MFEKIIERASLLVTKLGVVKKANDDDTLENLSHSQNIAWTEIDGWFDAAYDVIIKAFGENSSQLRKWENKSLKIDDHQQNEATKGKFHPIDTICYKINSMRGLLEEFQDVFYAEHKMKEIEVEKIMPAKIVIEGGIFIQPQIGGKQNTQIANSVENYIEQLKLNEYRNDKEKEFKDVLAELRREIENNHELTPHEKTAAGTDLAYLTDQLAKPVDKQEDKVKIFYWNRLKSVLGASTELVKLLAIISKLVGLA